VSVKIRLKRTGATKRPCYRLVVADARSPRDGRFIESIGFYDPLTHPSTVRVDAARVQHWLGIGARPSDAARVLLEGQGLLPRTVRRSAPAPAAAPAAPGPVTQEPISGEPVSGVEPAVAPGPEVEPGGAPEPEAG